MKEIGLIALLALLGPGFLALGVWNLRTRAWRDGVPAAELLIDRTLGVEPPPRNATDQGFSLVNTWLVVVFGAFFSLVLAAILYSFVTE